MRTALIISFLLLTAISSSFAQTYNETFTITTYYPSPYGVYKNLRLHPSNQPASGSAEEQPGTMYFNQTTNAIYVYTNPTDQWKMVGSGSGGGGDFWAENTTTQNIYNNNTGGRVGIGTRVPAATLHVIGQALIGGLNLTNAAETGRIVTADNYFPGIDQDALIIEKTDKDTTVSGGIVLGFSTSTAANTPIGTAGWAVNRDPVLVIRGNGNVGINTTAPAFELQVNGTVQANRYFYPSDRSLKRNIRPLKNSLEKVERLNGVSFEWEEDNRKSLGLVAQEVEKVFPELVFTDKASGKKSMEYSNLIAPLIESIKTLETQIKQLKAEIAVLKKRR